MKQQLAHLLLKSGYFAAKSTSLNRISALLKRIYPVDVGIPLIRLGAAGDGGYLVPNDIEHLNACFSPGVDFNASFELDLARRSVPCYLADASVKRAPVDHPLVHFIPKFLGAVDDGEFISLASWIEATVGSDAKDLILQMDIEGAEWQVILGLSDTTLLRFRIIVIELHFIHHIFDPFGFSIIEASFSRLLEHFHVVHLHPNNYSAALSLGEIAAPPFLEITLHRKDRAQRTAFATTFPHPLDVDCVPDKPSITLPSCWYFTT